MSVAEGCQCGRQYARSGAGGHAERGAGSLTRQVGATMVQLPPGRQDTYLVIAIVIYFNYIKISDFMMTLIGVLLHSTFFTMQFFINHEV